MLEQLVEYFNQVTGFNEEQWQDLRDKLSNSESEFLDVFLRYEKQTISQEISDLGLSKFQENRISIKLQEVLLDEIIKSLPKVKSLTRIQFLFYFSHQVYALLISLVSAQNKSLAIELCKYLLKISKPYYFNDIGYLTCKEYLKLLSFDAVNKKKYLEIREQKKQYLFYLNREQECEEIYNDLRLLSTKKKQIDADEVKLIKKEFEKLQQPQYLKLSYKYAFNYFVIENSILQCEHKFEEILDHSDRSIKFFLKLPFKHKMAIFSFSKFKLSALLKLRIDNEAILLARKCTSQVNRYSLNWFYVNELLLWLNLNSKRYEEAMLQVLELNKSTQLKNQTKHIKDSWLTYEVYIYFLSRLGIITPKQNCFRKKELKLFLEKHHSYDEDKRGRNISNIIGQLLIHIVDKKYDLIENRIYALKDYSSRYLTRKQNAFRSKCFINMLLKIPLHNFNSKAIKRHTKLSFKRMAEIPYEISMEAIEVEIIPYEDLWDLVMLYLESPKRKRKSNFDLVDFEY